MDTQRILELNIPDIHLAYGGVRGRTMSSRKQRYAWPIIKEAGLHTIIDLRNDGMCQRMKSLCDDYGMDYFYYPVDNRIDMIESMVELFADFCQRIDEGGFYIACAMGLHRTDIALSAYWVFYGADNGIEPPALRGYLRESGHTTSKIVRVLNAFYDKQTERQGKAHMSVEEFKRRKQIINNQSKQTYEQDL